MKKETSIRTVYVTAWVMRFMGLISLLVGLFFDGVLPLIIGACVGLALFGGGTVYELVKYRCPSCGIYIGMRNLPFGHCKYCGKPLVIEDYELPKDEDIR